MAIIDDTMFILKSFVFTYFFKDLTQI